MDTLSKLQKEIKSGMVKLHMFKQDGSPKLYVTPCNISINSFLNRNQAIMMKHLQIFLLLEQDLGIMVHFHTVTEKVLHIWGA